MKLGLLLVLALLLSNLAGAQAQVDEAGQTTRREMQQLRKLADEYFPGWLDRSDIDWHISEVWRIDLDDDGGKEAVLTYEGSTICGASTCSMIVVKWFGRTARVVSTMRDGPLELLPTKTNGWHDLQGHYLLYKWNGESYDAICQPGRECED